MNDQTAAAPPALPPTPGTALSARVDAVREEVSKAFIGQPDVLDQILIALLAGGHVLIEGVPGLGKTLLVRALAQALELTYARVQFTPDLMPGDVSGHAVYDPKTESFKIRRGPVFTHILLADEINRAPAKTQSALLEVMQEGQVTIEGKSFELAPPFITLATQNPVEQEGTYPLPEAQLDRFLLHIALDYPDEGEERAIIAQTTSSAPVEVPRVMDGGEVLALQKLVRDVHVGDELLAWITRLVRATRPGEGAPQVVRDYVKWGAGPRAGQSLVLASKARALLHGRFAATREDVQALAAPVMRHRLLLSFAAEAEQVSADDVSAALLRGVPLAA